MRPDILLSKRYFKHHDRDGEVDFVLDRLITPELKEEGIVNELVHSINQLRRKQGFSITDRVTVFLNEISEELKGIIDKNVEHIQKETLANYVFQKGSAEYIRIPFNYHDSPVGSLLLVAMVKG